MNVIHPEAPKADLRPAATPAVTAPAPVVEPTAKRPFWPWLLGLAALGGAGLDRLVGLLRALAPAATTAAGTNKPGRDRVEPPHIRTHSQASPATQMAIRKVHHPAPSQMQAMAAGPSSAAVRARLRRSPQLRAALTPPGPRSGAPARRSRRAPRRSGPR